MAEFLVTPIDFGWDASPAVLYKRWAAMLHENPNEWHVLLHHASLNQAKNIALRLRQRGCSVVRRKQGDAGYVVVGSVWRFQNEG